MKSTWLALMIELAGVFAGLPPAWAAPASSGVAASTASKNGAIHRCDEGKSGDLSCAGHKDGDACSDGTDGTSGTCVWTAYPAMPAMSGCACSVPSAQPSDSPAVTPEGTADTSAAMAN